MPKLQLLSLFLIPFLFSNAHAQSCKNLLEETKIVDFSALLRPLNINNLIKNIDFKRNFDTKSLNPSTYTATYTIKNKQKFLDSHFPVEKFSDDDQIIETDFGYVVLNDENLKAWTLLEDIISDPEKSQDFIHKASDDDEFYPNGITKKAALWLKKSSLIELYVKKFIEQKKMNHLENTGTPIDSWGMMSQESKKRKELFSKAKTFSFPFGMTDQKSPTFMSKDDSQITLEILARHFILSNLYIKRAPGVYKKLSSVLDRDSLMLLSRFPELLPTAPVFEGGHFRIKNSTTIGKRDRYTLVKTVLSSDFIEKYELITSFSATAQSKDLYDSRSNISIETRIVSDFPNVPRDSLNLSDEDIKKAFDNNLNNLNKLLENKVKEFHTVTSYPLPTVTLSLNPGIKVLKSYKIEWPKDDTPPPHILAAFYIFIGLQ